MEMTFLCAEQGNESPYNVLPFSHASFCDIYSTATNFRGLIAIFEIMQQCPYLFEAQPSATTIEVTSTFLLLTVLDHHLSWLPCSLLMSSRPSVLEANGCQSTVSFKTSGYFDLGMHEYVKLYKCLYRITIPFRLLISTFNPSFTVTFSAGLQLHYEWYQWDGHCRWKALLWTCGRDANPNSAGEDVHRRWIPDRGWLR